MRTLKLLSLVIMFFALGAVDAQDSEDKSKRPSPPMTSTATVNGGEITIDYSSPAVKGRTIFGDLVPYGKIWRLGANEATTITFQKDVTIGEDEIEAGKYAMFAIPNEMDWTIVFNSVWDQWGTYNHDASKDVATIDVDAKKAEENVERFTIEIDKSGKVNISWATTMVSFDIE